MKDVRIWRVLVFLIFLSLAAMGCQLVANTAAPSGEIGPSEDEGSVISGEEALRLYGITPGDDGSPEAPTASPESWFPMRVWVSASVLPYDDPDPIRTLPVYADHELGVFSTWVGDLAAESEVTLWSVHADGRACFIESHTIQEWGVKGWVACNRLLFERPTETIEFEGEGN
jgi:hypothetical protein